jgi:hypothetical protein
MIVSLILDLSGCVFFLLKRSHLINEIIFFNIELEYEICIVENIEQALEAFLNANLIRNVQY